MTDDEIRGLIRYQYDRGRESPSPMAEKIFEIAVQVRDWAQQPESRTVLLLRERLVMAERSAKGAWEAVERERNTDWRDRYLRLHKIHREDVRKRKEVRRFRLVNFSVAELEAELRRRGAPWAQKQPAPPQEIAAAVHGGGQ